MGNLWFELTGEYYKSVKKLESTDALFGIYNIWQSDKAAERNKELLEFRDHGTINGIIAYKL